MIGARILVVSADTGVASAASAALGAAGYDVRWERDSLAGLVAVESWQPALVVLDWALPFISGAIFLHTLTTGLAAPPPVIALVDPAAVADARRAGASAALVRPVAIPQVVQRVDELLA